MGTPGDHAGHDDAPGSGHEGQSLNRLAFSATAHCLTGARSARCSG